MTSATMDTNAAFGEFIEHERSKPYKFHHIRMYVCMHCYICSYLCSKLKEKLHYVKANPMKRL